MSDVVIVVGTKRGKENVSTIELRQMCVSKQTPIFIAGSPLFSKPAGDVKIGDMVVGVNSDTMKTVNGRVDKIFESVGSSKKICLGNGYEIVGANHPVMLWNKEWVSSDDLKIGDKVCVVASSIHQQTNISIEDKIREKAKIIDGYCRIYGKDLEAIRGMSDRYLSEECGVLPRSVYKIKKNGILTIRSAVKMGIKLRFLRSKNGSELDLDSLDYNNMPWIFGMIATDGNIKCSKTNTVFRLTQAKKSTVSRFANILKSSGFNVPELHHRIISGRRGLKASVVKDSESWGCDISSFSFVKILVSMGITPNKSLSLDLSQFLDLRYSDKVKFLSGIIDGDGNYGKTSNAIRVATASRISAYNLRDMFLSIGMYAKVGFFKNDDVLANGHSAGIYEISICRRDDVIKFCKTCGFSVKISTARDVKRNTRPLKGDCFYSRVKKIENAGVVNLVNFSVSNCETFICDGIVTHNCGRAGRKHGGETALAHIIVEDDRIDEVRDGLEHGANMEVNSSFSDIDKLIFHLMPEISEERVVNVVTAEQWYARSLVSFQGKTVDFHKVFGKMVEMGAIKLAPSGDVRPTKVGKIAADLYFHPGDVQSWLDNFTMIFEMGLENDNAAMAWALGTRTHTKCHGDFADHRFVINECKSALPLGLDMEPGTVTQVVLWWCSMGGPPVGKMRNQMLELREDIGRIKRALVRLDRELAGWNQSDFFDDVELMVRKGINTTLLDLCKLPGITKGRADFLYNVGARDINGIAEVLPNIEDDIDELFKAVLKEIVSGIPKQSH